MSCGRIILFFAVGLLSLAGPLTAQDFTIGTGTTGNTSNQYPCPLPDAFEGHRAQYLFRASELTSAGMSAGVISAIKFNVTALNNAGVLENFSIRVGATDVNALSSIAWDNFKGAPVSTPAANYQPVVGVNTFTLPIPFFWNGTDNVMVEICGGNGTPGVTANTFNPTINWTTALPFNATHGFRNNDVFGCGNATATNATTQTTRPNFTFTWTASQACAGTPDAGTVVSSSSLTCGTTSFVLSLIGNSIATGLNYQWQSSPNNTTWTNIAGATTAGIELKQLANTYYRVIVRCDNSGLSSTSASLLVNATTLVSGNFTIDNSLPSSTATAFKTFAEAYDKIKCGINGPVVFNVVNNATPYNEQVFLYQVPGASATNTITFNGNGASLNFLSTNTNERAVIKLDGADHFVFDGLNVNALGNTTSQYGYGFNLINSADSNIIRRCNIVVANSLTNFNYAGITMSSMTSVTSGVSLCDGNRIQNNTITGGLVGVSIIGDAQNAASRNEITNNIFRDFYQYAVYTAFTAYMRIEGNDISRPTRVASPTQSFGIYVASTTLLANISKNRIHSFYESNLTNANQFYGIYFTNADADPGLENIVSNNLIYNIRGLGALYGIYNSSSNAAFYYHNTISFDDNATTAVQPTYGYYTTSYTAGVEFRNNIISITRGGSGLKYHFYMNDERAALYTVNHNNYFSTLNNVTIKQGYYKGIEYTTLAEWRAATGFDANSVTMDPVFKDPSTGNFEPTSGALNDQGTPLAAVTTDINNTVRSTTKPDMGAYEFSLPSCNTNFQAGEAFSSVGGTSCVGKTVMLNLKNHDIGTGLTYTWESATTPGGSWTPISQALLAPPHTFTIGNSTLYYRASVSCNGGTPNYSTPVQIVIGGYFPAGAYTIDKNQPTDPSGTRNFNSFSEVVSALSCGIAGPVVFNVTPNTYTEQIRITEIPNTSAVNTITFQSQNGNAASAILSFAGTATRNYTVQLDSARNVIFRNMTIAATDQTNGRVFDIMNTASDDSIVNCVINAPIPLTNGYNTLTTVGIYAATSFKGGNIVIKGNTIRNGSKGIYIVGFATNVFTKNNTIEENTFSNVFHQAIFAQNTSNIKINRNVITMNTPLVLTSFNQGVMAISLNNCDSAMEVNSNNITLRNNTGYVYGIFTTGNDGTAAARGKIMNNKITAIEGLTNMVQGIRNTSTNFGDVYNNAISVSSSITGTVQTNNVYAAALVTNNAKYTNYYNNSLLNLSPNTGNRFFYNAALWVDHQFTSTGGFTNIFNNIIANKGGGPAAFINYTATHIKMDYNLYYAAGSLLIKRGPEAPNVAEKNYNTLAEWRAEYGTDINSIVYNPAFTSNTNLQPDAANEASWALQGRGIQLAGNNTDINGNPRSVTLTGGVPDLGAYEFMPTVEPPLLTATPAAPAASTTQVFTLGTDTVSRVTWAPGSSVPSSFSMKRYSGVLPVGMPAGQQTMYYYLNADATGTEPFKYDIQNTFIDPWLNTLPVKSFIKMGRTNITGVWTVGANSSVDSLANIIRENDLVFADKFTGMTNGQVPVPPTYVTLPDSTNMGTRFWSPYGFSRDMLLSNAMAMRFILASKVATTATLSVNATTFKRTYSIPAGGVIVTDPVPLSGVNDARLVLEGLSNRGILIESQDPIAAAAYAGGLSGVTPTLAWLLPTGTYTNEYTTLGPRQFSGYPNNPITGSMGTSWVSVIADKDNTVVEITPSGLTEGGRQGGVPFRVTLNRGEVYQIKGAFLRFYDRDITGGSDNSYEATDLTGTKIVSIPNSAGVCNPIGVFNGSGGTGIRCEQFVNGADKYMFQQTYPAQAWGREFLTAPLATRNSKNQHLFNLFRVLVKDANTVVKRNGVTMTGLTPGNFYEFTSRVPEFIEADKPIMVAQFFTYFTSCGNDEYSNPGSPESMFYLTPLGNGIKSAVVFRRGSDPNFNPSPNYFTIIIPDAGVATLNIDGSNTFDSTYAHPRKAGYTVVMRMFAPGEGVSTIESEQEFTATVHQPHNTYGYVYNAGFQVPRVRATQTSIRNVLKLTPGDNTYTCVGAQFRPKVYLPVQAKSITWRLSAVSGITPSADVTQNNPVAVDTIIVNFKQLYGYTLNQNLSFAQVGTYRIPVLASYAVSAASCDISADTGFVDIQVIAAPVIDYTVAYTGCINADATFTGTGTAGNGAIVDRWNWNFGDNTTSNVQNPVKRWSTTGIFPVSLQGIANDGCVNSTQKNITVNALPTLTLVTSTQAICPNTPVTFQVSNPVQGVTYSWFNVATGGTALATGPTFTTSTVTAPTTFYASATQNGCDIAQRVPATVTIIPNLASPVVSVDSIGTRSIRFRWNAVTNATGYEVTTNGGTTWSAPSSGSTGLTHTVGGLSPYQSVTIQVRALGGCTQAISTPVTGTTYAEDVFIPNSFTPNGDGRNDNIRVYATGIRTLKFVIFNQWGQKVYEGNDPNTGWDGRFNGKDAPMGVYMYIATVVLHNGEEVNKKGSINLIR
jgi:gliding motility-associated-like protein